VVLVTVADKAQEYSEWCIELKRQPTLSNSLPGGVEPLAWYYGALHTALATRLPSSRSLLILGEACQGLQQAAERANGGRADQLASYPQRHQSALFS
jgi:hypothetical protein